MTLAMRRKLFSAVVLALLMPVGTASYFIYDGGYRATYWGDLGDIKHLELNTTVPKERPTVKIYNLGLPPFGREWADRQVETRFPGWTYGRVLESKTYREYTYLGLENPNETISIYGNGHVEYWNESVLEGSTKTIWDIYTHNESALNASGSPHNFITEEDVNSLAFKVLSAHCNPPDGFYLDHIQTVWLGYINVSLVDMYHVNFQRKFDGRNLIGDGAVVSISPTGQIYMYEFYWKNIQESRHTEKVVSATEALLYLDTHLPVWFCSGQPSVVIDKIELGYHLGDHTDEWTETKPIWIMHATVGNGPDYHFYIDAVNLSLIEY
jgi:hypothetical protein